MPIAKPGPLVPALRKHCPYASTRGSRHGCLLLTDIVDGEHRRRLQVPSYNREEVLRRFRKPRRHDVGLAECPVAILTQVRIQRFKKVCSCQPVSIRSRGAGFAQKELPTGLQW